MKHLKTFEQFINEGKSFDDDEIFFIWDEVIDDDRKNIEKGHTKYKGKNAIEFNFNMDALETPLFDTFIDKVEDYLQKGKFKYDLLGDTLFVYESVNEGIMELNDFSDGFSEFYDFVEKYAKNMQKDTIKHIKEAMKHLDQAWEYETDAHGGEFQKYKINI